MQEIAERIQQVEDRLSRLLASGWRNVAAEAAELEAEADTLAGLGLMELADRLRKVAAASSAAEALSAIAPVLAACRLLRARLPIDAPPAAEWAPLAGPTKRKAASPDRLVPVGRVPLGEREAWACVHLLSATASDLVLLGPLPIETRSTEPPPVIASGQSSGRRERSSSHWPWWNWASSAKRV